MPDDFDHWQNDFPASGNRPDSTFPQPIPAPTTDPDASTLLTVQYGVDWQPVLLACLDQLLNPATWQGTHDDIILALNRATGLKAMLQTPITSLEVPPPYWDEPIAAEAGNETPSDTGFPWYEDLSFMFLEGFLATLVSPPAAFAYITTIKKLRLFFIYGQHGALFDVQIDGDTVATIDTYAPTEAVGSIDVIIP